MPTKAEEVTVDAPEAFAGGGKSTSGKLALKPIARNEVRIKPLTAAAVGGAVLAAIAWALAVRLVAPEPGTLRYIVSGLGLLLRFAAARNSRLRVPPRRRIGGISRQATLYSGGRCGRWST